MKPPAIGYLRRDVSGVTQPWDETQIRSLAEKLGYRFTKTVVFSERTADPIGRLREVVATVGAEAVVVPNLAHLGGVLPSGLTDRCEVVTVSPETTHTRQPPTRFG